MQTTLEPSATPADKATEDLARGRRKQAAVKVNDNWRTSIGKLEDTPEERAIWALGEQWRRAQTDP